MRPAVLLALVLCSCATTLPIAVQESPACHGIDVGASVTADANLIAQLAVDLPAGQLGAALDAFVAARGPAQFECAFEVAEALLGHPTAPLAAAPADAGPPSPLAKALAMNKAAASGALEKLEAWRASRRGP